MARIHIGTSGWVYPDWQGKFYPKNLPQKKWLEHYSQHFDTVEVNSSFYHLLDRKVYQGWQEKVGDNFIFAVKASRFITHIKRLQDCGEPLKRLVRQVEGLGPKLGPILFQLPPRWKANKIRLRSFLSTVDRLRSTAVAKSDLAVVSSQKAVIKFALEFRDQSWLEDQVLEILKDYKIGLCFQDSPRWPSREVATSDFVYLRFHGGKSLYSSNYSDEELRVWAEKIKNWKKSGYDVYVYFNNDVAGYAIENAKTLISLV